MQCLTYHFVKICSQSGVLSRHDRAFKPRVVKCSDDSLALLLRRASDANAGDVFGQSNLSLVEFGQRTRI